MGDGDSIPFPITFKTIIIMKTVNQPIWTMNRVAAIPYVNEETGEKGITIAFWRPDLVEKDFSINNSHRSLIVTYLTQILGIKTDWNAWKEYNYHKEGPWSNGYFGAFYSLIVGNSRKPELIVYGSSSDYQVNGLSHKGYFAYKKAFEEYCEERGWTLDWKVDYDLQATKLYVKAEFFKEGSATCDYSLTEWRDDLKEERIKSWIDPFWKKRGFEKVVIFHDVLSCDANSELINSEYESEQIIF